MATGKGGGNTFWGKQPPGNKLLDLEKKAEKRQAEGKNPPLDLGHIAHAVAGLLSPPTNPTLVGGKPVVGGPVFAPLGALGVDALTQLPAQVRHAHETAVKIAHPEQYPPSLGQNIEGLLSGSLGFPQARVKHEPRTLTHNDLEAQLPRARSRLTQTFIEQPADALSQRLAGTKAENIPGVRIATAGERVTKAAGRAQRQERPRAAALVAEHVDAIKKVKEGSPEDVANFWYAQLPKTHRNAQGLSLVRAKQAERLEYVTSGKALDDLNVWEGDVRAAMGAADEGDKLSYLKELERIKLLKTDLPQVVQDVSASIGQLDELIKAPPAENAAAIKAVHALNDVREPILVSAGRLNPNKAANRKGLLSRALGIEKPRIVTPADRHFNQFGEHFPNEFLEYSRTTAHNLTDDQGHTIGSMVLDARPDQPRIYVESIYLIPSQRNTANLLKLVKPLLEDGRPIAAEIQNPRLEKVLARAAKQRGIEFTAMRRTSDVSIGRGGASVEPIPPDVVEGTPVFHGTDAPAYIGHRLPKPDDRFPFTPTGGTGRVKSPKGVGSENKLILAETGRLRPSLRVALEDHASARVFADANQARDDLGKLGAAFTGRIPEGSALVNPKGKTIPPHWKTDELAQFTDGYEDIDQIRKSAQEIVDGFVATDQAGYDRMIEQALAEGADLGSLRVVPKRLVDRYYAQFRASSGRGKYAKAYDTLVDGVAASIIFARVGYIPKNVVQNVVMAIPHQGPFLLRNAVWAGQLMRDAKIRHLLQAEVGHGASGTLGDEALHKRFVGAIPNFVGKIADDPLRISAWVHEASAEGVLPKAPRLLNEQDKAKVVRYLTDKQHRPLMNDVRSRGVEAMAAFDRLTPDQSRVARRLLVIPGWLMAGTRYPFHFAATHPIRSALLAYIAAGEPGAPDELTFNKPVDEYFTGSGYKRGIQIGDKRLRTGSLSPVSTPWEIAGAVADTARGKSGPFDPTQTIFDYASPALGVGVQIAQGEGVLKSLERLVPSEKFVRGEISPKESPVYPEDASRLGRLKREIGVVPIKVNDTKKKKSGASFWGGSSNSSSSSDSSFWGRP